WLSTRSRQRADWQKRSLDFRTCGGVGLLVRRFPDRRAELFLAPHFADWSRCEICSMHSAEKLGADRGFWRGDVSDRREPQTTPLQSLTALRDFPQNQLNTHQ